MAHIKNQDFLIFFAKNFGKCLSQLPKSLDFHEKYLPLFPDDDQKSASVKRHQKAPSFSKVIDKGDWSISCKINDVAPTFVLYNTYLPSYIPNSNTI